MVDAIHPKIRRLLSSYNYKAKTELIKSTPKLSTYDAMHNIRNRSEKFITIEMINIKKCISRVVLNYSAIQSLNQLFI